MKPFILWMTGLPCSGKTTIVKDLQKDIPNLAMLDGDELREWFSPKDFSKAGRDEHNKKVAHLAKLLLNHGVPSVVSLVSPYIENRENAREIINAGDQFAECYVKCSLEECEIDDPYEAPEKADLVVDTEQDSLSDSANKVKDFLKGRNLL
jgi:adenylylsulfate kinase